MQEKIEIILSVKSSGKRKKFITEKKVLVNPVKTVNQLIEQLVEDNVNQYNQKEIDKNLFEYLTQEELNQSEEYGKIGFEDRKNDKQQDVQKAKQTALTAYYDGLVRVFINEQEIEYGEEITLQSPVNVTLIRMTMLVGRMW